MIKYFECYSEFKRSKFKGKIKECGTKIINGRQYYYVVTK